MPKRDEWIVTFLNEATDEQILHLFKQGIEESARDEVLQLLQKKDSNPQRKNE